MRQIVRDWVVRFNAEGPEGLRDRKAPCQRPRLTDERRAALARMVEDGPIPAVHGVVRWRLVDLRQWAFEEFRVTVSPEAGRAARRHEQGDDREPEQPRRNRRRQWR
jgi:hypothetical protein